MEAEFIHDREIYDRVILDMIPQARRFVWLATANIKDLYVEKGSRMIPFLEVLSHHIENDVQVRLLHSKEPGPRFQAEFDRFPALVKGLEKILCPRVHMKCVVVDGRCAYIGSANLTGAGMGARGDNKRNFESGVISSDPAFVRKVMEHYDSIWMGSRCDKCMHKERCPDYADMREQ